MLRHLVIFILAAILFSACQRYPELFYYITVQDAEGRNILAENDAAGKINVNDIVFERVYSDTTLVFHVAKDEGTTADSTNPASDDLDPGSVSAYGKDSTFHYAKAQYQSYSATPHLWINGDVPIGVKLDECPPLLIHWPDGTCDTLQIENPNGTWGSVKYYINHKRVKDHDDFINITK